MDFSTDNNTAICLKEITKNQFSYKDISEMFSGCINLQSVTEDIFLTSLDVTSAKNVFHGCSKLSVIPISLFKNNSNITTFEGAFMGSG